MSYIGINIGALTVKVARLDDEQVSFRAVSHQGRPVQALQEILMKAVKAPSLATPPIPPRPGR